MSLKMMPSMAAGSGGISTNSNTGYPEMEKAGLDREVVITGSNTAPVQQAARESDEELTEEEAKRRIKSVIDQANEKIKQQNGYRRLAFSYNKETKKVSIKVYDEATKEIIREIPPEKTFDILRKVHDLAGIVVDEKR